MFTCSIKQRQGIAVRMVAIITCMLLSLSVSKAQTARADSSSVCYHHRIVVKTNLLYDLAIPNAGVEIPLAPHLSAALNWQWAWLKFRNARVNDQTYGGDLELRYWLKDYRGLALKGHHWGLYLQALTYDVALHSDGYQSARWILGGGLSYGYSMAIGKNLSLDLTAGIGYLGGKYNKYEFANRRKEWLKEGTLRYVGPTKLEVTLVWNLGNYNL